MGNRGLGFGYTRDDLEWCSLTCKAQTHQHWKHEISDATTELCNEPVKVARGLVLVVAEGGRELWGMMESGSTGEGVDPGGGIGAELLYA